MSYGGQEIHTRLDGGKEPCPLTLDRKIYGTNDDKRSKDSTEVRLGGRKHERDGRKSERGVIGEKWRSRDESGGSTRRVRFDLSVNVRPRSRALRSGISRRASRIASVTGSSDAVALLRAARDNEEELLYQALGEENLNSEDVNVCDNTGRVSDSLA